MRKKQIILIGVVLLVVIAYVGIKTYASKAAEKKINIAIAKVANYADVDYKNVSVDLFGFDVHISDILVSPVKAKENIKISEMIIHDYDERNDIPLFLDVSLKGVEVPLNKIDPNVSKVVKQLGYGKIYFNFDLKYNYNKENKELNLKQVNISADDVAKLEIGLHLGNIDLNPEKIITTLFSYPQIMLYSAKLIYYDDSLTERIMQYIAQAQNKNLNQIKTELKKDIDREILRATDSFTKKILRELQSFIDKPDMLSIFIMPKRPLPIGRIMRTNDPEELVTLMGIKIES